MSPNPTELTNLRAGYSRLLRRAITIAGALAMTISVQAHAIVMPGDHFNITWIETSPTPGLFGTGVITIGGSLGNPYFAVSDLTILLSDGTCFTCALLTEDLTGLRFDAATLDLKGDVTGTFLGSGGNLHTFDLALTDTADTGLPLGTWTFTNVRVFDQHTEISSGTYAPLQPANVPEPSSLLLIGSGLAGLAGLARRRGRRQ